MLWRTTGKYSEPKKATPIYIMNNEFTKELVAVSVVKRKTTIVSADTTIPPITFCIDTY
ncbi:MAG: hypothetical protein UZ22_OP11002000887 [Microgenomates bacterium OLB23]|nr:MAG: hypothetical protein UZ22_OP11002000887 [Microgenomates bacterium OLB23]